MENLDKKCRLCLKLCCKYQHLFRNHSGDTNAEKLYDVVKIQVLSLLYVSQLSSLITLYTLL